MKKALTDEEWIAGYSSDDVRVALRSGGRVGVTALAWPLGGSLGDQRDLHALAALCLHEQDFGFTRDDVIALRSMTGEGVNTGNPELDRLIGGYVAKIQSVADRIEALLPPAGA